LAEFERDEPVPVRVGAGHRPVALGLDALRLSRHTSAMKPSSGSHRGKRRRM